MCASLFIMKSTENYHCLINLNKLENIYLCFYNWRLNCAVINSAVHKVCFDNVHLMLWNLVALFWCIIHVSTFYSIPVHSSFLLPVVLQTQTPSFNLETPHKHLVFYAPLEYIPVPWFILNIQKLCLYK